MSHQLVVLCVRGLHCGWTGVILLTVRWEDPSTCFNEDMRTINLKKTTRWISDVVRCYTKIHLSFESKIQIVNISTNRHAISRWNYGFVETAISVTLFKNSLSVYCIAFYQLNIHKWTINLVCKRYTVQLIKLIVLNIDHWIWMLKSQFW